MIKAKPKFVTNDLTKSQSQKYHKTSSPDKIYSSTRVKSNREHKEKVEYPYRGIQSRSSNYEEGERPFKRGLERNKYQRHESPNSGVDKKFFSKEGGPRFPRIEQGQRSVRTPTNTVNRPYFDKSAKGYQGERASTAGRTNRTFDAPRFHKFSEREQVEKPSNIRSYKTYSGDKFNKSSSRESGIRSFNAEKVQRASYAKWEHNSLNRKKTEELSTRALYSGRKENIRDRRNREDYVHSDRNRRDSFSKGTESQKRDYGKSSLLRLNRYISNAGICSRRAADNLILDGKITINNQVVTDLWRKVESGEVVKYNSKTLIPEDKVYILLNKPKGYTTTVSDPNEKKTVMDLIKGACQERVYPIGRLDKDTSGVLLFTNDGDLAKKLSHPSSMIPKVYRVVLSKELDRQDLIKIREGVILEDGVAIVDKIEVDKEDPRICGVEIHIGKNRIVRRIFESLGYEILLLERNLYAGLTRSKLKRGNWRLLMPSEVINLKRIVKEIAAE